MFTVKDLSFAYTSGQRIFEALSFCFDGAKSYHIMGENGSGKSTMAKLLTGHLESLPGMIKQLDKHKGVYYLSQNSLDNFVCINVKTELKAWSMIRGLKQVGEISMQVIDSLQLRHLLHKPVYKLSSGEQKLMALVPMWFTTEWVWVLDEPFANLDAERCAIIAELLMRKSQEQGNIILIDHSPWAKKLGFEELLLSDGALHKVVQSEPGKEIDVARGGSFEQ